MKVRPAGLADASAIAAVQVHSWRGTYRGQIPDEHLDGLSIDRRSVVWTEILGDADLPRTGVFVLEDENKVVGFAHFGPSRDPDAAPRTGELTAIYLVPEVWGHGGGRLLLEAAETNLREAGFRTATLWVLSSNTRARRFYERMGWTPDGAVKTNDRGSFTLVEVRYASPLEPGAQAGVGETGTPAGWR